MEKKSEGLTPRSEKEDRGGRGPPPEQRKGYVKAVGTSPLRSS